MLFHGKTPGGNEPLPMTFGSVPNVLFISRRIQIPLTEFDFTFARSGGPGGQNVNKVNSKAILRWPVVNTPSLPDDVKQRFLDKYANRITTDGDLVLSSQKSRDQSTNIELCIEKLRLMVVDVVAPPVPRKPTKVSFAAKKKRVEKKREHSQKKRGRGRPSVDE